MQYNHQFIIGILITFFQNYFTQNNLSNTFINHFDTHNWYHLYLYLSSFRTELINHIYLDFFHSGLVIVVYLSNYNLYKRFDYKRYIFYYNDKICKLISIIIFKLTLEIFFLTSLSIFCYLFTILIAPKKNSKANHYLIDPVPTF